MLYDIDLDTLLLLAWFGHPACFWVTSRENTLDADCWFYWRNVDAAAAKKIKSSSSLKTYSDKTSRVTGSSAAMFLVDVYPGPSPLPSETCDQMIRFNLFRLLSEKKCSSICREKKNTTENSVQMLSVHAILAIWPFYNYQDQLQVYQAVRPVKNWWKVNALSSPMSYFHYRKISRLTKIYKSVTKPKGG